jgi:hypothetical protein
LGRADGSASTVGSAAGVSASLAIEKAVQEAFMLQRTIRGVSWPSLSLDCPRTSLDHVARAYRLGPALRESYRSRAERRVEIREAPSDWSLRRLVQASAMTFGCDVVSVNVTDAMARSIGWTVCRVIVPNAYVKESDSTVPHLGRFFDPGGMQEAIENDSMLCLEPHPFG